MRYLCGPDHKAAVEMNEFLFSYLESADSEQAPTDTSIVDTFTVKHNVIDR